MILKSVYGPDDWPKAIIVPRRLVYKKDKISHNTRFLVWQIDETENWLRQDIVLTDMCINRLEAMKSSVHRKGFLSIRHLLKALGYTPAALHYDVFGKPHLADGKFISITHSHNFAAIAVGDNPLGVDIEKERPKVQRIAPKFLSPAKPAPHPM